MKIAWNFLLTSTKCPNNHESTEINLTGHFLHIFSILKNACSIQNFDISVNIQLKS